MDDEPAKCIVPDHQRFDLHQHRSIVVLPDGTEVTAVSFDARDPYARDQVPDFGLYLDPQWLLRGPAITSSGRISACPVTVRPWWPP